MSQYRVVKDKKTFVYGFDRVIPEYFMTVQSNRKDIQELVGSCSSDRGTNGNLLNAITKNGLVDLIPEEHLHNIMLDLPF